MKAFVVRNPASLESLELREQPEPNEPGLGEIRVRLHASSLNYHDYSVVTGAIPTEDGRIPMSDGAGVVDAVGPGVQDFVPGDRVVSTFFPNWLAGPPPIGDFSTTPGDGIDGYAREWVVCPERYFTHAPAGYTHEEAATLTTAGLTAWRALMVDGPLKPGATVLTLGTGGVSIFAVQLAKMMGGRVISTSSSDAKLARLSELGADEVINYRREPEWGKRVMEMTNGRGADHIIEVGGPGTLPQSIQAVAIGGHIALIGVLTGVAGEVPTARLMTRQARLQGLIVGSRTQQQAFVRALEVNGVRPIIDQTFELEAIADAFRHEASGQHFGKIGLSIA